MSIVDKVKGFFEKDMDPVDKWQKEHKKAVEANSKAMDKEIAFASKKNECFVMIAESEALFKRMMNREVQNARYAKENGIDPTLNKNQFSDAMRGLETVKLARWKLNTMNSEAGLQEALRLLNASLRQMNRVDGETNMVNSSSLRRRITKLSGEENVPEDESVLPPTVDYKYKMDNGLFENMVDGMSYEEAIKLTPQDLSGKRNSSNNASSDMFDDIFKSAPGNMDTQNAQINEMLKKRKDE